MKNWLRASALGILALLAAGCETAEKYSLTHKLWSSSDLNRYSEPAPNSNLALFEATERRDVLVQYDAISERHSAIKRRAYLLEANRGRVASASPPQFIEPAAAGYLRPIPIQAEGGLSMSNSPPATGDSDYARTSRDGRQFTLYRAGATPETFDLPVYLEGSGTGVRVAVTPLAVAGDAAMVGAVAAVAGFFGWLAIGAPGLPPPALPHPH